MIRNLPESEGNLIGFQASGKLTSQDYEESLVPEMQKGIDEHGKVRLLLYFDETFEGWDAGAMWQDTKFGVKHCAAFEKIALVGGPGWVGHSAKLFGFFMPGAVETFESSELKAAWDWLR